jgi:glycosyltransferase involved in cell wall biosynthesis
MKQRILHVIDTLDRGGTAKQLCLLARGLPQDEFETYVVALDRGGSLGDMLSRASILVHVIGRRWSADPLTFWQLLRHVKKVRPDAVVGWQAAGRAYAAAVSRRCGVRCLVAVWSEIEPRRWPLQRTIDRYIVRRAHVVATCPAVRDYCLAQQISPNNIQIVPSGTCKAASPVATRGQLLDRLGLPQTARLIGWAGKLSADRGVKDAIWAADLLKVIRDDAHLLICGTGPHRDRLIRFRDQVEIGDKVHFLGDGDMDEILPHLDQFWSTRRVAGHPQAVLEAMAAGLPVVATDLPGTRDLIEHEVTGYLVAPGHRAGFARWAEHLFNHPDAARRIGAAGRERVERDFSAEKTVGGWQHLLRVAGSRSGVPASHD